MDSKSAPTTMDESAMLNTAHMRTLMKSVNVPHSGSGGQFQCAEGPAHTADQGNRASNRKVERYFFIGTTMTATMINRIKIDETRCLTPGK